MADLIADRQPVQVPVDRYVEVLAAQRNQANDSAAQWQAAYLEAEAKLAALQEEKDGLVSLNSSLMERMEQARAGHDDVS